MPLRRSAVLVSVPSDTVAAVARKATCGDPGRHPRGVGDHGAPDPPTAARPSRERARWLMGAMATCGRLNVTADMYEELRAEACVLEAQAAMLRRAVDVLRGTVVRGRAYLDEKPLEIADEALATDAGEGLFVMFQRFEIIDAAARRFRKADREGPDYGRELRDAREALREALALFPNRVDGPYEVHHGPAATVTGMAADLLGDACGVLIPEPSDEHKEYGCGEGPIVGYSRKTKRGLCAEHFTDDPDAARFPAGAT